MGCPGDVLHTPHSLILLATIALRLDHGAQEAYYNGRSSLSSVEELSREPSTITGLFAGQCQYGKQLYPSVNPAFLANAPLSQPAQNVIIEFQFKSTSNKANGAPPQRSCYLGWTGMPSKRKLAPVVARDGGFSREQEISTVEIDTTFGRLLGLTEGQKVCIDPHID